MFCRKAVGFRWLSHLSFYQPYRKLYALCSCCACCCHDLQLMLDFGQDALVVHSDFVAETDDQQCVHCGDCVARCAFKGRRIEGGELVYDPGDCYGCGLCVTTCPAEATVMKPNGQI